MAIVMYSSLSGSHVVICEKVNEKKLVKKMRKDDEDFDDDYNRTELRKNETVEFYSNMKYETDTIR